MLIHWGVGEKKYKISHREKRNFRKIFRIGFDFGFDFGENVIPSYQTTTTMTIDERKEKKQFADFGISFSLSYTYVYARFVPQTHKRERPS